MVMRAFPRPRAAHRLSNVRETTMRTFAPLTILGTILVPLLHAAPAQALNNKSWVSSTGTGSTCTRALPCGNFQTAHDQTNAGGEIGVVDSADYGLLVISKAISI